MMKNLAKNCVRKKYIVLVFLLGQCSLSAQQHEPDITWPTLETPHFYVHFPKNFKNLGNKIGSLCEEVYNPVSRSL